MKKNIEYIYIYIYIYIMGCNNKLMILPIKKTHDKLSFKDKIIFLFDSF